MLLPSCGDFGGISFTYGAPVDLLACSWEDVQQLIDQGPDDDVRECLVALREAARKNSLKARCDAVEHLSMLLIFKRGEGL